MTVKELKQLVKIAETLGIEEVKILESGRDGAQGILKKSPTDPLEIIMWEGKPELVVLI